MSSIYSHQTFWAASAWTPVRNIEVEKLAVWILLKKYFNKAACVISYQSRRDVHCILSTPALQSVSNSFSRTKVLKMGGVGFYFTSLFSSRSISFNLACSSFPPTQKINQPLKSARCKVVHTYCMCVCMHNVSRSQLRLFIPERM